MIILKNLPLHAQGTGTNNSNYWYYWDVYSENGQNVINKKNAVKQKTIISKSPHKIRKTIIAYDTSGRVSSYKTQSKEVKIKYYQDDLKQESSVYKKGKLVSRDSFLWDDKNLQSRIYYNRHNKLTERESYKYDSTYVTEYVAEKFKKGKFVETRKRVLEYYSDYSYKKITYYKKGKPTHYSVFDCNPVGENHKIKKDSAYNCVKYDVDSLGNKIKVTIVNENRNSRKTIEYFNTKDQRIAQKIYDLKKDQLLWYITYKPGSLWSTTKYITYKKGIENYRQENTYDENDECISWAYYVKGKLRGKTVNSFNQKRLLEKSESFGKRNKKNWEADYLYEYY
jgi:hypothetical protein